MKTVINDQISTASQSTRSFPTKKEEGVFFVQTKTLQQPFFTPVSSQQNGMGSTINGEHKTFFQPHSTPLIQAKLTINEPGDQYEKEADAMSEQVMRMNEASMGQDEIPQTKPLHITSAQRKCNCEEEEKARSKQMDGEQVL
jgi:hypothetical protein